MSFWVEYGPDCTFCKNCQKKKHGVLKGSGEYYCSLHKVKLPIIRPNCDFTCMNFTYHRNGEQPFIKNTFVNKLIGYLFKNNNRERPEPGFLYTYKLNGYYDPLTYKKYIPFQEM